MSSKLNKASFERFIKEDIEWLLQNTNDTLEQHHIIMILKDCIEHYYTEDKINILAENIMDDVTAYTNTDDFDDYLLFDI